MSMLLIGLVVLGLIFGAVVLIWVFNLLQRLVAILRESKRPAHQDAGIYDLKQGRELRSEQHNKHK